MSEATDTQSILYENLMDAGCDKDFAKQMMTLISAGNIKEALSLLSVHRKVILEHCHAEQKKIDCLDYLMHQLKKAEPFKLKNVSNMPMQAQHSISSNETK